MTSDRRPRDEAANLDDLVQAAGTSLADAAKAISGDLTTVPTAVAISEAELTLKVAVEGLAGSRLKVRPVSSNDLLSGMSAGGISEIKIRFVTIDEGPPEPRRPVKNVLDVLEDFRGRADIKRLGAILDDLKFEASYVPDQGRWLVTARDNAGRVVREAIIDDEDASSK